MASETLVNVTLPEMGESVSEGSIVEWRKKIGDWVDEGDTLVDVTTDKVDVEVPSTASGVVTARHGDEGATIPVGAVLVEIDTTAAKPEGTAASAAAKTAAPSDNVTLSSSIGAPQDPTLVTPASYGLAGSGTAPAERRAGNGKAGGVLSHHARRLVERLHIDASKLTGTGPDGLILREDVEAAVASGKIAFTGGLGSASAAPTVNYPPASADAKVTDLKGSVATLASYMEQSLSIPVAT
ncbi:MAG TPA: biotin/lipoyl-containing protein, partial [Candidatus Elarobacter sp.]